MDCSLMYAERVLNLSGSKARGSMASIMHHLRSYHHSCEVALLFCATRRLAVYYTMERWEHLTWRVFLRSLFWLYLIIMVSMLVGE
jgi:hypothetical protein